jgi:hypothetical protein
LNQISPVEIIQTIDADYTLLSVIHHFLLEVLFVIAKELINPSDFVNQIVTPFKTLPLGSAVYIKILILDIFDASLFNELFKIEN